MPESPNIDVANNDELVQKFLINNPNIACVYTLLVENNYPRRLLDLAILRVLSILDNNAVDRHMHYDRELDALDSLFKFLARHHNVQKRSE